MKKKIRILLPAAVILLCNMYYVFFGIDRVNPMMAFVDHPYTITLLLIMGVLSVFCVLKTIKTEQRREAARLRRLRVRNKRLGKKTRATVPATKLRIFASIVLGFNILGIVLALIGLLMKDLMLYNYEYVKYITLVICLLSWVHAILVTAAQRKKARKAAKKRKA